MVHAIVPDGAERDTPRPVAQPVRIRALHPAADGLRSLECLGIQDELARGVSAQEDVAAGQARHRASSRATRRSGTGGRRRPAGRHRLARPRRAQRPSRVTPRDLLPDLRLPQDAPLTDEGGRLGCRASPPNKVDVELGSARQREPIALEYAVEDATAIATSAPPVYAAARSPAHSARGTPCRRMPVADISRVVDMSARRIAAGQKLPAVRSAEREAA